MVERSNVLLLGGRPQFKVFEEVGSGTLTVRVSAWGNAALIAKHPASIAKVTGLTAPAGY